MHDDPRAILVIGLAFGDCGKGAVVDFLTRHYGAHTVVRFNGGPQAAHNVVTPAGLHHTFSQFGSGTFTPGTRTFLSRFMLIEPYALFNEAAHLESLGVADAWDRLFIDARCPVITPPQQAANRLRELARGPEAHGTCGVGVGETVRDLIDHPELVPAARELSDRATIARKLRALCDLKADQLRDAIASLRTHPAAKFSLDTLLDPKWIGAAVDNYAELAARASVIDEPAVTAILRRSGTLLFEGAQGVLLDERFGFHPHTTWSTTTFANAESLLDEAGREGRRARLGVLRSYFTRHGPGPFVTGFSEDAARRPLLPEPHNGDGGWPGPFRTGVFDAVAARYALAVAGPVDGLAITHLDRLTQLYCRLCRSYRDETACDEAASDGTGGEADPAGGCFVRQGDRITDLRVRRPADLAYQERLGRLLRRCKPADIHVAGDDVRSFLDTIERELQTPVVLASSGPTANEKRVVRPAVLDDAAIDLGACRAASPPPVVVL